MIKFRISILSLRKCWQRGLHPVFSPLSKRQRGLLHWNWPAEKPHLSSTGRWQSPSRRAVGDHAQDGIRLKPWNDDRLRFKRCHLRWCHSKPSKCSRIWLKGHAWRLQPGYPGGWYRHAAVDILCKTGEHPQIAAQLDMHLIMGRNGTNI